MSRTRVIFRKDAGEIVAVFPEMPGTTDAATMTVYAHMGQHGPASLEWYYTTQPATPDEYRPLLNELVSIGYDDLTIGRRITQKDDRERYAMLGWVGRIAADKRTP